MKSLSIKTVPQWVRKLASVSHSIFQIFRFSKSYFWPVGLLMVSTAPLYATPPGNALSFNGANTYVQMSDVNLGTSDFTLEGWIKPNVLSGYIYSTRTVETGAAGNWFIVHCKGFELATGSSSYLPMSGTFTPTPGAWYHFAIVRNPTTITLYFNGILDTQVADNASLRNLTTGNVTRFGGNISQNAGWFNGQIDEFRVWNVARTQTQIQSNLHQTLVGNEANLVAYYNFDQTSGSTLPDLTGYGHDGTLFNGPSWTAATWKYSYPYVTTGTVSALTATTAAVGGTVVDAGISAVTASGICYATSASPTTPCTTDGPTGIGSIPGSLTGLTPQGTTYYARPYATNSTGTIYSYASDVTFTTRYIPVIAQGTSVSATMSEDGFPTAWSTPTISATNLEGDTMTWTLATPATHGTATVSGTGASPTITYSPTANYNGTDSFVVQVAEVDGVATITVNVTVTAVNDAPVASNGNLTTNEDTVGNGAVEGADVEGSTLTYHLVTDGSQGAAVINTTTGAFTYTPTANLNGSDSFTFKANDGTVDSTPATITVTITPVNDIPTFTASNPPVVLENTGIHLLNGWATFNPGPNETDHLLTYTVSEVSNPGLFSHWPNVSTNGALTYQSAINQSGTSTFTVTVQDTGGTANGGVERSAPQNFTLTVIAPEINVQQGGVNLSNGKSFDFGSIGIGSTLTKSFLIENQGTFELLLNNSPPVVVLNNQAGEFSVDETSTLSFLAVGGKTTFTLSVTPSQLGAKSVTVVIPNTDSDESSYRFDVTATSVPAQLLKIFLAGPGIGHITSDPTGIDCTTEPTICTLAVINPPRWIDLTATPDPGFKFTGWSGEEACQATGKVFVMANTACVATFELQSYELSVGRLGQGQVKGPGLDCPPKCIETFLYGTEIQLEAVADREWIHTGWKGSCDQTGKVKLTNALLCQAVFQEDPTVPNQLDGNGDGIPDAHQPNVISLPDKVTGSYVAFAVQPETCVISDVYTDLPDNYGKSEKNKPLPQGLIYFDLACPQAQISLYYHAVSTVKRNVIFRKFGPLVPGNEQTAAWYLLPNVTFEAVMIGGKSVVKASYTLKDGELGDSTGVDGRIVDPGGIVVE